MTETMPPFLAIIVKGIVGFVILFGSSVVVLDSLWEIVKLFSGAFSISWCSGMIFMLIAGLYGVYVGYRTLRSPWLLLTFSYSENGRTILVRRLIEKGEILAAKIVDIKKMTQSDGYIVYLRYNENEDNKSYNISKSLILVEHNIEEGDTVHILHTELVSVIL